ncbi:MAG: YceD family protein [Limisphaerales bacterium]|jgi:uncharacterized protein|nr:hypothetical protein [Verrucomicrobiota bacterium]
MRLLVNLRDLEAESESFQGEVDVDALDLNLADELIRPDGGLQYDLVIDRHEQGLLLHGILRQSFVCECARCLQPFEWSIELSDWSGFASLEGDDALEVQNDLVDLTEVLREDVLLALPQHPHCGDQCPGLVESHSASQTSLGRESSEEVSPWEALDHLRLENEKD